MKVCFTGGGTGGHVFPAFAIDSQLSILLSEEGEDYQRFWMGSGKPEEQEWVESTGMPYFAIRSGKLRRYLSWRIFPDMVAVCVGFWQALYLLRREKPDVIFSKGGYVSVPPVLAARLLRIPAVTHESDALPGLATKINARFVQAICISFADVSQYFPPRIQPKLVVTGVPSRLSRTRAQVDKAYQRFGISAHRKVIVVLGGSQGAAQINSLIWENLDSFLTLGDIVHQTGSGKYQKIEQDGYHALPFITEGLEDVLKAASVVISRAGATAIADFLEMEVPMVLIPLSVRASRGDQVENARRLERIGAAQVFAGETQVGIELFQLVKKVVTNEKLRREMIQKSISLRTEGAGTHIAQVIFQVGAIADKRSKNHD